MDPGITQRVVAIFGEALADCFPEQAVLGGAPFNVARHLQAFGMQAMVFSRIGRDALGAALLAEMHHWGMATQGVQQDSQYPTGQVRVLLESDGQHRFEILPQQAYDFIDAALLCEALKKTPPQRAYLGTLAQRNVVSRMAADAFLSEVRCPVFADINLRAPWFDAGGISATLQAAETVKLNDHELALLARMFGVSGTRYAQAHALQQRFDIARLLVTCGPHGCWMQHQSGELWHAAPSPVGDLVDTVGAGDAFSAVFLLGDIADWPVPVILQRACDYAAAVCTQRGAGPLAQDALAAMLNKWQLAGHDLD